MKKIFRVAVVCMVLCLPIVGCQKTTSDTGETLYKVDPNAMAEIESGLTAGALILQVLADTWVPGLSGILAAVLTATQILRKIKPKLTEAQNEATLYHTLGSVTVEGIDTWRNLDPQNWEKLKAELEKVKDKLLSAEERRKIDNLIRGLCGKPPRE